MADPLLFAAYAAGKWLEKQNRLQAEEAKRKSDLLKEEAKQKAENTIQYYVRPKGDPTAQPVLLTPMLQDKDNYDIVYEKLGTAPIQKVDPKAVQEPLYWSPTLKQTGTKSFFEQKVVPQLGKWGTVDDFKLQQVGTSVVKGTTVENKWFPTPLLDRIIPKDEEAKKLVIAQGTIVDKAGQPQTVYAETVAALEIKYPDAQRVGQVKVSPDAAKIALGVKDVGFLSTELKSFPAARPKDKKEAPNIIVGQTKEGRFVFGEDVAAVVDQGAVKTGQAKDLGLDNEGKIQTGSITWFTPEEKDKGDTKQFVSVRELGEDGQPKSNKQTEIPLWKFQENPDAYEPIVGFQVNPDGTRSSIDIGIKSSSDLSEALAAVDSPIYIEYKDRNGKPSKYYLTREFKNTPLVSLQGLIDQRLPKKPDGSIDFTAAGMTPTRVDELATYAANLIKKDAAVVVDGVFVPNDVILNRRALDFENAYPVLSRIPGLKQKVQIMVGMDAEETIRRVAEKNSVADDGTPQGVVVAERPTNDPTIDMPIAVPYDPKYQNMVDLVLTELAPSGSPAEVKAAKNIFPDLVDYERDATGSVVTNPDGSMRVAKRQPDFDFLNYLSATKHAGTPLLSVYRNMLRPNKMRELGNDQVETDIKRAFNEYVPTFDAGMTMISSFLPRVGRNADRIYFEMQTEGTGAVYEKEKEAQKAKADASQLAVSYLSNMRLTFFDNGKLIDMGTAMGQLYLAADGLVYMGKQAIGRAAKVLDSNIMQEAMDSFDKTFISITESSTTAQIEKAAKEKNMSVNEFITAEDAARKEIIAMQNRAAKDGGIVGLESDDNVTRNLALRNYYRYMVAYSVAAAIQGGTGGRTISDQDVLNVLEAFKMDSYTAKAESELAIIDAAISMLTDMGKHATALSQGGEIAFSARKLSELRLGSHGGNYTIRSFSERLEQPGKPGSTVNVENELSDRQLLMQLNMRLPADKQVTELDKTSPEYKRMIAELNKKQQGK